eukprot:363609-Chlamydomonas_euryale.AAC.16
MQRLGGVEGLQRLELRVWARVRGVGHAVRASSQPAGTARSLRHEQHYAPQPARTGYVLVRPYFNTDALASTWPTTGAVTTYTRPSVPHLSIHLQHVPPPTHPSPSMLTGAAHTGVAHNKSIFSLPAPSSTNSFSFKPFPASSPQDTANSFLPARPCSFLRIFSLRVVPKGHLKQPSTRSPPLIFAYLLPRVIPKGLDERDDATRHADCVSHHRHAVIAADSLVACGVATGDGLHRIAHAGVFVCMWRGFVRCCGGRSLLTHWSLVESLQATGYNVSSRCACGHVCGGGVWLVEVQAEGT